MKLYMHSSRAWMSWYDTSLKCNVFLKSLRMRAVQSFHTRAKQRVQNIIKSPKLPWDSCLWWLNVNSWTYYNVSEKKNSISPHFKTDHLALLTRHWCCTHQWRTGKAAGSEAASHPCCILGRTLEKSACRTGGSSVKPQLGEIFLRNKLRSADTPEKNVRKCILPSFFQPGFFNANWDVAVFSSIAK